MSFRKRQADPSAPEPETGADSHSGFENQSGSDDQAADPAGEPQEPLSELEQLRLERDEAVESWKRARADYQNLRRRQQADIDSAVSRSREGLLAELLLVLDTLDMALTTECRTDEARNLLVGVQMVRHQMLQFLGGQGVTQLDEGGVFDPETHQAIETVATDEHATGDIVQTVRRGFRMGDRMLRHAQVKVAADPQDKQSSGSAPGNTTAGDEGPAQVSEEGH